MEKNFEKLYTGEGGGGGGGHLGNRRVLQLKDLLKGFTLGHGNDGVVWRWDEMGVFTVKSTCSVLSNGGLRDNCGKTIWRLRMPIKIQILVWLILKKRHLTMDNLVKRGWMGNTLCVLCGTKVETVDHLFTRCVYLRYVMGMGLEGLSFEGMGDDVRHFLEKWMTQDWPMLTSKKLADLSAIWVL